MTTPATFKKEEYAKAVCFFLAEMLRSHRITLQRSSEIAQKVVENISLIDTEEEFLKFIKELTADFEDLYKLEQRVILDIQIGKREEMEAQVREFVIVAISENPTLALSILTEAIKENSKTDSLADKFPQFKQFVGQQNLKI